MRLPAGSWVACTPFLSRIGTRNLKYVSSSESSQVSSGSWRATTPILARIGTMNREVGAPISRSAHSGHATPRRAGARRSGSWRASTSYMARIGTMNRGGFVAQAFEPAGSGDFPVARSWSTGLESPVNPQAGKPALQAGSWVASFRFEHASQIVVVDRPSRSAKLTANDAAKSSHTVVRVASRRGACRTHTALLDRANTATPSPAKPKWLRRFPQSERGFERQCGKLARARSRWPPRFGLGQRRTAASLAPWPDPSLRLPTSIRADKL